MDERSDPASGVEAFSELERFLQGAATLQLELGAVERESERRGRELVRVLLQAHIDARGDGDVRRSSSRAPGGPCGWATSAATPTLC
jgi:hypothetical protein